MSDAPSGKLKEQDLTNLDVTKLTPSSPEVISRQATINIGTIGHVAHGKSTIVKAVSGVQTVRFKNELERNITIKLGSTNDDSQQNTSNVTSTVQIGSNKKKNVESNLYSSKIKVPSKEILSLGKSLENTDELPDKVTIPKHQTTNLKLWKKKSLKTVNNSDKDQNNSKIFKNPNDFVVKKNLKVSVCKSSNTMSKADGDIGHLNSVSPIVASTETTTNDINSNTENLVSTDYVNVCDGVSLLKRSALDTAFVTIPPMSDLELDQNDIIHYKFITGDSRVKTFILGGGMIEFNDSHIYDPNEIDEILDDVIVYGIRFYLVKWKNWSRGFNTWERFSALINCQISIYNYGLKKESVTDEIKPIDVFHLMLPRSIISKMFELFRSEIGLNLPMISTDDMSAFLNSMDIGTNNVQKLRKKTVKYNLATIFLSSFRQKQLIRLKEWEIDINIMTDGYRINVENNMDLEGPPDFFIYSPKYVPHGGIIIPDDPPIGCSCKGNCLNSNNCCNEMSGYSAVYDSNKCITVATGCPVFECNKKCKCSSTCNNRVVQLGSKVNVSIYKTSNCGWGVKTNQIIKKGQFVAEYIGEVITVEESERRLKNNISLMDYMWNLDFDDSQNYKYVVDGTHYANFTYFINHSCHSNLSVYNVWINCLERNLPQLALFANRDISPGEQLTSDYFARCNPVNLKQSGIKCLCRVKHCKGYYF